MFFYLFDDDCTAGAVVSDGALGSAGVRDSTVGTAPSEDFANAGAGGPSVTLTVSCFELRKKKDISWARLSRFCGF